MPLKKKVTAEGGEAEGGAFRWTLENERKLLVLTQGRYLTGEDYERLVGVFSGTNLNGVKIKVSRFRVEQRKLYDEYGWTLPDGGAKFKQPATPRKSAKKRDADAATNDDGGAEVGDGAGAAVETPSKRPRVRKPKKDTPKKGDDGIGSGSGSGDASGADEQAKRSGVKEEVTDEF